MNHNDHSRLILLITWIALILILASFLIGRSSASQPPVPVHSACLTQRAIRVPQSAIHDPQSDICPWSPIVVCDHPLHTRPALTVTPVPPLATQRFNQSAIACAYPGPCFLPLVLDSRPTESPPPTFHPATPRPTKTDIPDPPD